MTPLHKHPRMKKKNTKLSIDEQVEIFEQHFNESVTRMVAFLTHDAEVVKRRAILRMRTVGLADYGDRGWQRNPADSLLEQLDEVADGAVYGAQCLYQESLQTDS